MAKAAPWPATVVPIAYESVIVIYSVFLHHKETRIQHLPDQYQPVNYLANQPHARHHVSHVVLPRYPPPDPVPMGDHYPGAHPDQVSGI